MKKQLRRRGPRFAGATVGLDLHQKFIQYSLLDRQGDERENGRIDSDELTLRQLMDHFRERFGRVQVVMEACGCFIWVYDLLKSQLGGEHVRVAAPSKVQAIAQSGEKDDASDAWWLAYLLWDRRLPEAFVAEGDLRELRVAARELRSITDQRSDLMRQMRSHLRQLGLSFARSDWASVVGRQRIDQLVAHARDRHGMRGQAIARLWSRIGAMNEEVEHWQAQVEQLSQKFDEVAQMQKWLPGVGPVIAAVVWSELGDPRRYRQAGSFAKATGLTPGYRHSGGRKVGGAITREGSSHVRWALTRAVIACMRCRRGPGVAVRHWVQAMSRRKCKKVAIVAAARKLAESIWRLFALGGEALDLTRVFGRPPALATLGAPPRTPASGGPRKPSRG